MKNRLFGREIALITVPTLALAAFAFYSMRAEKIGPRGLYVEKSELVAASPLYASQGYSHYMKVTLNYGGWKPKWWKKERAYGHHASISPSSFGWTKGYMRFLKRDETFAIGDELTTKRDGKPVVVKQSVGHGCDIQIEGARYVIKHYLRLSEVPTRAGGVTFRSTYALRELEPLRWEKVVRRAGEKAPPVDRNPHAQILGWTLDTSLLPTKIWVVKLRHKPRQDQKSFARFDDVEIVDGRGQVFRYGPDFNYGVMGVSPDPDATIVRGRISLFPGATMKRARPPFTLRGKVSVNDNWPIPFSHRLTP